MVLYYVYSSLNYSARKSLERNLRYAALIVLTLGFRCFGEIMNQNIFANLIFIFLSLGWGNNLWSLELKPDEIREGRSKTDMRVVQNRYFQKSLRPAIGLAAGKIINESYTDTAYTGGYFNLFFTETVGLEIQHFRTSVSDTEDRKTLEQMEFRAVDEEKTVHPDPEVNPIYSVTDIQAAFIPFYGKLNILDFAIIYSDFHLVGGLSSLETGQGRIQGYAFGMGQRFYLTKAFALRLDLHDRIFTEQRARGNVTRQSISLDLGVNYFFL